jgi:hypothetical protein
MFAAIDPDMLIAYFAIGGLGCVCFWRLIVWVRDAPTTPDPWDAAVEQKLAEVETPQTCPHCSTPQSPTAWFCPHCGRAVGPYNNLMPFVQIFSEGEVFRNGTSGRFRNRRLIMIGYFLLGLTLIPFFLAPLYWLSLLSNLKGPADQRETLE